MRKRCACGNPRPAALSRVTMTPKPNDRRQAQACCDPQRELLNEIIAVGFARSFGNDMKRSRELIGEIKDAAKRLRG